MERKETRKKTRRCIRAQLRADCLGQALAVAGLHPGGGYPASRAIENPGEHHVAKKGEQERLDH